MSPTFRVWVSRRFWPWPKRYRCKAMLWGDGAGSLAAASVKDARGAPVYDAKGRALWRDLYAWPNTTLCLILHDERRVFIDAQGREITYGREFFEWMVEKASQDAGQPVPVLA